MNLAGRELLVVSLWTFWSAKYPYKCIALGIWKGTSCFLIYFIWYSILILPSRNGREWLVFLPCDTWRQDTNYDIWQIYIDYHININSLRFIHNVKELRSAYSDYERFIVWLLQYMANFRTVVVWESARENYCCPCPTVAIYGRDLKWKRP